MHQPIILVAVAGLVFTAAAAHAQPRAVSTKGLDLSVAADVKVFYKRLSRAAADACGGAPTYFLGSEEWPFRTCFKQTLDDAVAKAHAPLVAALHGKAPGVQLASGK